MLSQIAKNRRVVITGVGAVTPLGNDVSTSWQNLLAGESGVGPITRLDASKLPVNLAAEVKDFIPTDYMPRKTARRYGPFIQYALAAAQQAVAMANLQMSREDPTRVGLEISTALGGVPDIETQSVIMATRGYKKINPTFVPAVLVNMPAGLIAIDMNIQGPLNVPVSACATGLSAIGEAARRLIWGDADVIIAGATEGMMTPLAFAGFGRLQALTNTGMMPFDARRDGTVIGEGAAVVVLETLDHAQARNAKILAEVVGYGMSSDAYHVSAPRPDGSGAAQAINRALQSAQLQPTAINYIAAHGTGTPLNDVAETKAVKTAFGQAAYNIPMSSIKSMTGHTLGAAGAIAVMTLLQGMADNLVPPTINLQEPDPACDLDYIPNTARSLAMTYGMANAFGFGGQNVSLILKRWLEN